MAKADETARAVVVALRLVESGILANVMYRYDLFRGETTTNVLLDPFYYDYSANYDSLQEFLSRHEISEQDYSLTASIMAFTSTCHRLTHRYLEIRPAASGPSMGNNTISVSTANSEIALAG